MKISALSAVSIMVIGGFSMAALAESYECKVIAPHSVKTGETVAFSFEPRSFKLTSAPDASGKTTEQVLVEAQKVNAVAPVNLEHATISYNNMPDAKSLDWRYKTQSEGHYTLELATMSGEFFASHMAAGGAKTMKFQFVECVTK